VAQENIELPKAAQPVEHAQVGAFFTRFDEQGRRFVPNPELRSRYPDDNNDSSDYCSGEDSLSGPSSTTSPPPPPSTDAAEEDDAAPMSTSSE
jgi:hypothetical protein